MAVYQFPGPDSALTPLKVTTTQLINCIHYWHVTLISCCYVTVGAHPTKGFCYCNHVLTGSTCDFSASYFHNFFWRVTPKTTLVPTLLFHSRSAPGYVVTKFIWCNISVIALCVPERAVVIKLRVIKFYRYSYSKGSRALFDL